MTEAPHVAGGRPRRKTARSSVRPSHELQFRTVRPSLLDLRFCGDPWIVDQNDGTFAIYLGDYRLTNLVGSSLDLPALNRLFDIMRHRRPRQRGAGLGKRE